MVSSMRLSYWKLSRMLRSSGQCQDLNVLVFLDYDGTLTPIVDNPTDAVLPS